MARRLAIVMGRNYSSRLGMIRAAGDAGCDVSVIMTDKDGGRGKKPVDAFSKYVTAGYYRSPQPDTENLISLLLESFSGRAERPILLPTDDYTASTVDLNMDRLKPHFLFPNIRGELGKTVHYMDKAVQKDLARKAGFDVAKGWSAIWSNGSYAIPDNIEFPCFIKPEISYKGSNKQGMQRCDSRSQLESALSRIDGREDYPILIEQYIDINQEYDVPALSLNGSVILPGIIKKGEIYLGVTATGEMHSSKQYPSISDRLKAFLEMLCFTGLADIELFESNGIIYFNELNLRFGASGFGMTGCGINLPRMLIQYLCQEEVDAVKYPDREVSFASEKTLLQKRAAGKMSRQDYQKVIQEADFTFIASQTDPAPYTAFKREECVVEMKLLIKRILRMK